jgi:methionine synthase II (cobalamin-independent)
MKIGHYLKMIIYGEIIYDYELIMKEYDPVIHDIISQLKQNGHDYIQYDDGEIIELIVEIICQMI